MGYPTSEMSTLGFLYDVQRRAGGEIWMSPGARQRSSRRVYTSFVHRPEIRALPDRFRDLKPVPERIGIPRINGEGKTEKTVV